MESTLSDSFQVRDFALLLSHMLFALVCLHVVYLRAGLRYDESDEHAGELWFNYP